MKKLFLPILFLAILPMHSQENKNEINAVLNSWHQAAGAANFNDYFSALTDDSIFIGTDATENWNKTQFEAFAKPYFHSNRKTHFLL
jgi:ketosteroid isomerase-like protein